MKRAFWLLALACCFAAMAASADTIILKDGGSYTGSFALRTIKFTDQQGIQYEFPIKDVQSLSLNAPMDTVVLRNGKSYTGHYSGPTPLNFQDAQGIQYQFPVQDVDAIVLNGTGAAPALPPTGRS